MNHSVIDSGYVGTTIATCFANLSHDVINIDIDEDIVETINNGTAPVHKDDSIDLSIMETCAAQLGQTLGTTND